MYFLLACVSHIRTYIHTGMHRHIHIPTSTMWLRFPEQNERKSLKIATVLLFPSVFVIDDRISGFFQQVTI